MLTVYDESSMIIAFRNNLFSAALKEEDLLIGKIDSYKEGKGKELYFPPYINEANKEEDIFRYCYDKNKQLCMIQVMRRDQLINAVYFIDRTGLKKTHTAFADQFHFAAYSYLYSILNDENNTLYNIKISPDRTPEQKLVITYDDSGNLKRISFSSEEDIVFYEVIEGMI